MTFSLFILLASSNIEFEAIFYSSIIKAFLNFSRRIIRHNRIYRHVLGNDGFCSNNRTVANLCSRDDGSLISLPRIIADDYIPCRIRLIFNHGWHSTPHAALMVVISYIDWSNFLDTKIII